MPVDATLEKPLPNNLDAERSVRGSILLHNNALNPGIEHLRPDDFFLDQHRRVFTQMIALGEVQQAIDLVTLTEELNRKGDLEASGGAPYLASLADGMPKVSNIEHYARIVKEKAILRNLIHTTHNIQQRAFEGEDRADAILDGAESWIFALPEDRVRAGLLPFKDIVRDNFERLERIFKAGKIITGIPPGYAELDQRTGSRRRGAAAEARERIVHAGGGLAAVGDRGRAVWEPGRRSGKHPAQFEGLGEGTADSRAGAQPAHTRAGARRTRAAALGFARVGRHRTGRRRGDVHLQATFLQSRGDAGRAARD